MANLLDTIRQNSQALPQQGVTDESQKLQTLLRAKSGKAVGGGPVASSNLAEQSAVAQTNQQLQQQVAPAAAIQSAAQQQQSSEIQQQEQLQRADIAQSRRFDDAQTRIRTEQTLRDLERGKGTIDERTKDAQVEQVAANLRLQNKQYTDTLNREGQMARLNDDSAFQKEALRAAMENKLDIVSRTIDTNTLLNANDREFEKKLASMNVNDAWSIFNADRAAAKQQGMWSGAGALAKAGIEAYGNVSKEKGKVGASSTSGDTSTAGTTAGAKNQSSVSDGPSGNIFADINRGN